MVYGEGDIVTLPDDYEDPFNFIQPPFNHDSTNHSTNKNDISNNNYTTIQPNKEGYSNGSVVESKDKFESEYCSAPENGLKVESKATDSERPSLKVVESWLKASHDSENVELVVVRFLEPVLFLPAYQLVVRVMLFYLI